MSSLYDATMKREKMIEDFSALLNDFRCYLKAAHIPVNVSESDYPDLTLYREACRIHGMLPRIHKFSNLCLLEGEYHLLSSMLEMRKNKNHLFTPYSPDHVVVSSDEMTLP